MRHIALDSSLANQLAKGKKTFYAKDLNKSFPTLTPGEWVTLTYDKNSWCAYGNPHAEGVPTLWIMSDQAHDPWSLLSARLSRALKRREGLYPNEGKRLVYGQSDELPGLLVDAYDEHVLIQINTAGMDRFRDQIKDFLAQLIPQKKIYLFDHASYRSAEGLPQFSPQWDEQEILHASDSGFGYALSMDKMQKIGFYYDHRDNRNKFEAYLGKVAKNKESALDLFSYLGAWGLHAARAGVRIIDLVDQANLEKEVLSNFEQANYKDRATFHRSDVFKFLDSAVRDNKKWDVVVCDPPAFCKSQKQKAQALAGYQKLYNKIMKLLAPGATLVAASCTKYVSQEELCLVVSTQARQCGRKIFLRDTGVQAMDHPFEGPHDNANYIKYALYAVE